MLVSTVMTRSSSATSAAVSSKSLAGCSGASARAARTAATSFAAAPCCSENQAMPGTSSGGASAASGIDRRRSLTCSGLPAQTSPILTRPACDATLRAAFARRDGSACRYGTSPGIERASMSSAPATDSNRSDASCGGNRSSGPNDCATPSIVATNRTIGCGTRNSTRIPAAASGRANRANWMASPSPCSADSSSVVPGRTTPSQRGASSRGARAPSSRRSRRASYAAHPCSNSPFASIACAGYHRACANCGACDSAVRNAAIASGSRRPDDKLSLEYSIETSLAQRHKLIDSGQIPHEELIRMEDFDDPREAVDEFFNYTSWYVLRAVEAEWDELGYVPEPSARWGADEDRLATLPMAPAIEEGLKKSDIIWVTPDTSNLSLPC